jgi:hypothetical protein
VEKPGKTRENGKGEKLMEKDGKRWDERDA